MEGTICIPAEQIRAWENVIFLSDKNNRCTACELVFRQPVSDTHFSCRVGMLSEKWEGTAAFYGCAQGRREFLTEKAVSAAADKIVRQVEPENRIEMPLLGRERIVRALEDILSFLFRAKNSDEGSPAAGGMYLFYDLDSQTYRNDNWNWTWGQAIGFLLESGKIEELESAFSRKEREDYAKSLGDAILRNQMKEETHCCYGIFKVRWQAFPEAPRGICSFYSAADKGMEDGRGHGIESLGRIPVFVTTRKGMAGRWTVCCVYMK